MTGLDTLCRCVSSSRSLNGDCVGSSNASRAMARSSRSSMSLSLSACKAVARCSWAYSSADSPCRSRTSSMNCCSCNTPHTHTHTHTRTHTHTHTFNGPFSGTTQVSRYQKGKTNLDFTEASGSGISWAICKSASRSRQITMPVPHSHHSSFLQAGCPSCCPTNSVKALKALSGQNLAKFRPYDQTNIFLENCH